MAACTRCHKDISLPEAKKQKVVKGEDGRLVGVYHLKCWYIKAKRARYAAEGRDKGPDAYEASAQRLTKDDTTVEAHERRGKAQAAYDLLKASATVPVAVLNAAQDDLTLAVRQEELAEDRALESAPQAWADWRDPDTLEL